MLSNTVAAVYEISTLGLPACGNYGIVYGSVNFPKLTLKEAEELVNRGFPHLQKKAINVTKTAKSQKPIKSNNTQIIEPAMPVSSVTNGGS